MTQLSPESGPGGHVHGVADVTLEPVRGLVHHLALDDHRGGAAPIEVQGLHRAHRAPGGSADDHLTGDAGPNAIDDGAGNDPIEGGGGDDNLNGNVGVDTVKYANAVARVVVNLTTLSATGDRRPATGDRRRRRRADPGSRTSPARRTTTRSPAAAATTPSAAVSATTAATAEGTDIISGCED